MKKVGLLLLACIALLAFTGTCRAANPDLSASEGMNLTKETMQAMFGGEELENVVETLSRPLRKVVKSDFVRWYFKRGVQVDVVSQNDEYNMLFNYVYIGGSSDLKTNRRIGIGSPKNEVIRQYGKEINKDLTNDKLIFAGDESTGLVFKMKNGKVSAIFIGLGCGTMDNGGFADR